MCTITNQDIDDLKSTFGASEWVGRCFDVSYFVYLFFLNKRIETTIVYANITINGKIMSHAWVEYEDLFLDLTQPQKYWAINKKEYYAQATIHKIEKYTSTDIAYMQKKYNKSYAWGDWLIYD